MYPDLNLKHLASLVIKEIKNLKGNEKLDITDLRNGDQIAMAVAKSSKRGSDGFDMNDQRWHGGGGGGGTPANPTTSVQFNNNGAFGGDEFFTWDETNQYVLIGNSGGIGALTPGNTISLFTPDSDGIGNAGIVNIVSGNGLNATYGGDILLTTGNGGATGNGGNIILTPGTGDTDGTINFVDSSLSGASNGYVWKLADQTTGAGEWAAGGGGGTPASPDTSIQFNDGGNFGGIPSTSYYALQKNLSLGAGVNGVGVDGGFLTLYGGDGNTDSNGGSVDIFGGFGSGIGDGAAVTITGGDAGNTAGTGGAVTITGGASPTDGIGGAITLTGGVGGDTGDGGTVYILGGAPGSNVNAEGGDISMAGGSTAKGEGGQIILNGASTTGGEIEILAGIGIGASDGAGVSILGGDGGATTGAGGTISITGGVSGGTSGNTGGVVEIAGGESTTDAGTKGGDVYITSGAANNSTGTVGSILIHTGPITSGATRGFIGLGNETGTHTSHYFTSLGTTNATPATFFSFPIPASSAGVGVPYLFIARITARRTGGSSGTAGDCAAYVVKATYRRIGSAAPTILGAIQDEYTVEDQPAWDATYAISSNNIIIQVTGAANNNITWIGEILIIT